MRGALAALALWLAAANGYPRDGLYVLHAAGCVTCHTAEEGVPLAGGRPLETPFGVFYSPNITPDAGTGIGGWSRQAFIDALKHGRAPDGSAYFPVFPYTSYRWMTDEDAGLIFDHLQSLEPRHQVNREHELPWWLGRWMMKAWQWWVLDPADDAPAPVSGDPQLQRGRYLVDALGHCGECHTPRDRLGVTVRARHLGGNPQGPEGDKVPNVTPHREDGIGRWDRGEIAWFLETGELPNGDYTGSLMSEVIDDSTSRLTKADRMAIAAYLKSIAPLPGP